MKKIIICVILWALVVGWMGFIFSMSAETAEVSTQTSGNTIKMVLELIYPGFKELPEVAQNEIIENNQLFARKTAHFSIYTVLGILLSLAVYQHINHNGIRYGVSLGLGMLYSISDEIHQSFVPLRTGRLYDVVIDSLGVALGCFAVYFIYKKLSERKRKD